MATFADIQTRVEGWLIDLPSFVEGMVPALINKAHKEIQDRHNFKVMEAEFTSLTTVGTRAIVTAVPSTFKEWRLEAQYLTDDDVWKEISWAPNITSMRRWFSDDDEGAPEFLFDPVTTEAGVRTLHVYPLPDGESDYDDGEYRLYIPYYAYLPDLSGDSDTDWFTSHADWYMTWSALSEGFGADWDPEQLLLWKQKAEEEYAKVVKLDKMLRLGGMREMVPHWQGARKPFTRR